MGVILKMSEFSHLGNPVEKVFLECSQHITYPLLGPQVGENQVVYEAASFITIPLWLIEWS